MYIAYILKQIRIFIKILMAASTVANYRPADGQVVADRMPEKFTSCGAE
jgi:hypothetical protein